MSLNYTIRRIRYVNAHRRSSIRVFGIAYILPLSYSEVFWPFREEWIGVRTNKLKTNDLNLLAITLLYCVEVIRICGINIIPIYRSKFEKKTYMLCSMISCLFGQPHKMYRADSRFAPSQWETALLCNGVSHWPGGNLESSWMYTTLLMSLKKASVAIGKIMANCMNASYFCWRIMAFRLCSFLQYTIHMYPLTHKHIFIWLWLYFPRWSCIFIDPYYSFVAPLAILN